MKVLTDWCLVRALLLAGPDGHLLAGFSIAEGARELSGVASGRAPVLLWGLRPRDLFISQSLT